MSSLISKIDVFHGEADIKQFKLPKIKGKHTFKVRVTTLLLKAISHSFRDSFDVRLGAAIMACCTVKIRMFERQIFR